MHTFNEIKLINFIESILGVKSLLNDIQDKRKLKTASVRDKRKILMNNKDFEDEDSKQFQTLSFRLADLFAGSDGFCKTIAPQCNQDIKEALSESLNYIKQDKPFKNDDFKNFLVYNYLDQVVRYFLDLMFLFRCQTYLVNNENDFKLAIIKEVFIPQFALILFSDIPNEKFANLMRIALKQLWHESNQQSAGSTQFQNQSIIQRYTEIYPFKNQSILDYLPEYSPLKYLLKALREGINIECKFMVVCRRWVKIILQPIHHTDSYKQFVTEFLDKLTSKNIPVLQTLKQHISNLIENLEDEKINYEMVYLIDQTMGVMQCLSILERIKKILIDSNIDENEVIKIFSYAESLLENNIFENKKNNNISTNILENKDFNEIIQPNREFIERWKYSLFDTDELFENYSARDFQSKTHRIYLSQRSRQLSIMLAKLPVTQSFFYPSNNQSLNYISHLNFIINNFSEQPLVSNYENQAAIDSERNKNKPTRFLEFKPHANKLFWNNTPQLSFDYESSWELVKIEDFCNLLYTIQVMRNFHQLNDHKEFYSIIFWFNGCLIDLLNNNLDNAKKNINQAMDKILQSEAVPTLGIFIEYILSFYLGLKAYQSQPNFPALKKIVLWLTPLNTDTFLNPQTKLTISKIFTCNPEEREVEIEYFLMTVRKYFNYFCLKGNRLPNIVHDPYNPIFLPLKDFIVSVNSGEKLDNDELETLWKNKVSKTVQEICNEKMHYSNSNIINILENYLEHFNLFVELYLDGHKDSDYIHSLLYERHDKFYLNAFILKKLTTT